MAGRNKNRSEPRKFTISVPSGTANYLVALANIGRLGSSEAEVAAFLVVREVDQMLREGYIEKRGPI